MARIYQWWGPGSLTECTCTSNYIGMLLVQATHISLSIQPRGVGRNFFKGGGGGILNAIFQKVYFCTDLFPNTL